MTFGTHRDNAPGRIEAGQAVEYERARLLRDVTTAITWFMEDRGIKHQALAERMKVTPGRVSQILSGDENLTLRTLATVCAALDAHFRIELVPNGEEANQPPAAPFPGMPSEDFLKMFQETLARTGPASQPVSGGLPRPVLARRQQA